MTKPISPAKLAANRRNAQKSTGPKSPHGKAISRFNALKQVVIHGYCIYENKHEFLGLHQALWQDKQPLGALEEWLVDEIAITQWRHARAIKAESAEIALSVDGGHRDRSSKDARFSLLLPLPGKDPVLTMQQSAYGTRYLLYQLEQLRETVEEEGKVTQPALKCFGDSLMAQPNPLSTRLKQLQQNESGLNDSDLKKAILRFLDDQLEDLSETKAICQEREEIEELSLQAAQALPPAKVVDKFTRYAKELESYLFRCIEQLDRLQRRRLSQNPTPPLALDASHPSSTTPFLHKSSKLENSQPLEQQKDTKHKCDILAQKPTQTKPTSNPN